MVRVTKSKKSTRIVKEFVNKQFTEVKKEKMPEEDAEEEEENNSFSNGASDFSSGSRTAPVLRAESRNLEQVAATAPARRTTSQDSTPSGESPYAANYTAKYTNEGYGTRQEQTAPVARASGALGDIRNFDMRGLRKMQSAWQSQESQQAGPQAQTDANLPPEKKYQLQEDNLTEATKRIDKRRRMF